MPKRPKQLFKVGDVVKHVRKEILWSDGQNGGERPIIKIEFEDGQWFYCTRVKDFGEAGEIGEELVRVRGSLSVRLQELKDA